MVYPEYDRVIKTDGAKKQKTKKTKKTQTTDGARNLLSV